jgi:peptidyl-prolyl cis-trans isomerase A (cyclophilin A)
MLALAPLMPQGCPFVGPDGETDPPPIERGTIETTAQATLDGQQVGTMPVETDKAVTLSAAVAPDDDDGTISYAWVQYAGKGASITDADQPVAQFAAPSVAEEQELRFMVTTYNDAGDVGRAEVAVRVEADPDYGAYVPGSGGDTGAGTSGPTADAGTDQTVVAGDTVTLDGSESTGAGLDYAWRQSSGPTVTLKDDTREQATFVAPPYRTDGQNEYVFVLRVTDNRDRSTSDSVTVTVLDPSTVGQRVLIETTFGNIVVELDEEAAPITVENFLAYINEGFYTNTIFHRVIPGFVVQGGGFLADLTLKDTRDPIVLESDNGLKNLRGTIAMARRTDPDSATSQFYFNVVDNDALDYQSEANPGYAVFGSVFSGMDVVDRIATVETETRSGMQDVPVQDVLIRSVTLID